MVLFTTACFYKDQRPIRRLQSTARQFGYNITPYGIGQRAETHFERKCKLFKDFLETRTEEHVVYIDGNDSFFCKPLPEIDFSKIYFQWAGRCNPIRWKSIKMCSGWMSGPRTWLIDCFETSVKLEPENQKVFGSLSSDEARWQLNWEKMPHPLAQDKEYRYSQAIEKWKGPVDEVVAPVLHFPGKENPYYEPFYRKFGCP